MQDDTPHGPMFQAYDKDAVVYFSQRHLPHRFQPGTATFVTFRTDDSMPREAIELWERRLRQFLQANGFDDSISIAQAIGQMPVDMRRSFQRYGDSCYHKFLDKGFGACVLRKPELSAIVAKTLLFYNGTNYDLDRFVVMPNHVHLLAAFRQEFDMRESLENCLHYSAFDINQALGTAGAFWQGEPFDHCIRNEEQLLWVQNYIKENPKKARLRRNCYHYWQRPT